MIERIKKDRDEFLFLLGVTVFTIWAFLETLTYQPTSAAVPQLMLTLIGVVVVLTVGWKLWGEQIQDRLNLEDTSTGFEVGGDEDPQDSQLAGLYEIDLLGVGRELVWILAYLLGIIYIGFFIVSSAFSISYILAKETSPLRRRIPMAIGWTAIILGILYVLFIQFLQVSSVWRLGFLP